MPVIVKENDFNPHLPTLESGSAIAQGRALRQDIRPLEVAVLNLMADKIAAEKQLAFWLGRTPLQINLTFVGTDRYVRSIENGRQGTNTPSAHILQYYRAFSDIRDNAYDALLVTGVNARKERVTDEDFWTDVEDVFRWSETNVFSSLFLCWGAKAALKHFQNIDSIKQNKKIFGLFEHRLVKDRTGLLANFPDRFSIPVSRWKSPDPAAIEKCPKLDIVATSDEVGPNILVEAAPYLDEKHYPKRVYVLNHPEYETDTLRNEHQRDIKANLNTPLPQHYFPGDDPSKPPLNTWRFTGDLYTNWVHAVYDATPYDLRDIPSPFGSQPLGK